MANYLVTPNMQMPNPVPGVDPGPDYAFNLQGCINITDQHNHSPGNGALINPNGIYINSDLTFNANNATLLRTVRFSPQVAPLALSTDVGCLYVSGVDLYYNDGNGNQIRMTNAGATVAAVSSIVSGSASAAFSAGTLVVKSSSISGANALLQSVELTNSGNLSNILTLQAPTLSGSFSQTLPALPGSTSLMQIDPSGIMSATVTVASLLQPAGIITAYGGASAPSGWLLCDGTSYLQATYPALYSAIGANYGAADGTHFNVPDFRGMFLRGVTGSTTNDPDASGRTANNSGGNTGNNVGSQQSYTYQAHSHGLPIYTAGSNGGHPQGTDSTSVFTSISTDNAGGNETRPINVYVTYIIKT